MEPLGIKLMHSKKDFTMSVAINVKPADEQNYLKNHALLCLSLATFLIVNFVYLLFAEQVSGKSILDGSVIYLACLIIGFITLMVMTFKTAIATTKIKKSTYYYGNFQDEYLNHVNAKGYKYVFIFMCFYLIAL
jgi:uncharacterized membrane protein